MTDYITQTWEDLPAQTTPLDAARLQHMEDGIAGAIRKTNNLLDLADIAIARTNLGLGTLATKNTIGSAEITDGSLAAADFAVNPYARANHTGTQLAATISDFNVAVRTNRLDQMATPTGALSLGGQTITNLAAPSNPNDAVTKSYADALTGGGGGGTGPPGPSGPAGQGVPIGGTTNQVLAKISAADYDTAWTTGGGGISPSTWDANSIVKADLDDTPVALTVPASTFVGRGAAGPIAALTAAQAKTVLAITPADVAGFDIQVRTSRLDQMATPTASVALGAQTITGLGTPANPTDAVTKAYVDSATGSSLSTSLYDAFTILRADVDNTPTALTVSPSTFVGRAASGGIVALDAATAKTMLAITAADLSGLGTLATKSTITSAEITDGTITSADIADATIVNADIALGAAIDLAKLAVDPLARANHTGTQLAATVSDFDTRVRTSRLDQMAIPTALVNLNGQVATGLATPVGASDATNKAYVDNVAAGLDFKSSVKAGATTNVTIASPGTTIDGVTMASGNRVLLAGQTTATENGIYVWNGAASAMTRAIDADVDAEVTSGMYVFVEGGTANGAKAFVLTTPDPIVLGTTALSFTLFSGGGTSVVGTANRITVTGTQIDISAAYVGQASLTTLGTITTGVWNGTAVPVANGGTGGTTAAQARANLGIAGAKYTTPIGNGSLTSFTVTHNLNTKDVLVEVYETATGITVYADVTRTTLNVVTIAGFLTAPATNLYTVVVMG